MIELIGKKYNRLTVIADTGKRTKSRTRILLCKCDCGNYKEIAREKLRHGTKSCGCLKNENIKPRYGEHHHGWKGYEDISLSFFSRMKASAALRDIEFSVDVEHLWELYIKQNRKCALSGIGLELPKHIRKLRDKYDGNLASLDRIDNDKGYIKGNLQWVCKRINYMKHTMKEMEFLKWVSLIHSHRNIMQNNL